MNFLDNLDLTKLLSNIGIGGDKGTGGINSGLGNSTMDEIETLSAMGNMQGIPSVNGVANPMGAFTGGFPGNSTGGFMSGIFGDEGILSKDNLAMGSDIVGMGTGIMGMYNSIQDRKIMDDMVKYGKRSADRDRSNTAIMYNDKATNQAKARNIGTGTNSYTPALIDGSPI